MAFNRDESRSVLRFVAPFLALTLIVAFAVHDIQLKHEHVHREAHGHEGSTSVTEYLHAMDRKLFIIAIFFLAFSLWLSDRLRQLRGVWRARFMYGAAPRYRPRCGYPRRFSWLALLYGDGILHSRHYG